MRILYNILFIGIYTIGICLASASNIDRNSLVPIDIRNTITIGHINNICLLATIKNNGTNTIDIYSASLPWGTKREMIIVLVPTTRQTPLQQVYKAANPEPGVVYIRPGEAATGEIHLIERFPDLPRELTKADVMCFWSYQTKTVSGLVIERNSGYLLIPRTKR
jgi:hypothetical protein